MDQFIPHVVVSDGLAALEFYKTVFGGTDGDNMMAPDGKRLLHGEVVVDGCKLFVSDEFDASEGGSLRTPRSLDGTSVRITMAVNDADAVVARAEAAGAEVIMAVQDMFWGARYGRFVDPFGHEWGINQQVAELTQEEEKRAADEFFAKSD
ncbi:MAG TPA: VOC family protein [Pyrinomonadaceae bacterium]|jgi:PhnB protein|nr:VOC family protein [Pyrinomonadaceae bacterium]